MPRQVDDKKDGEQHEAAISAGQVEDDEGGDGALVGARQDAPDDEGVARDAQEEDEAEDERAHHRGGVVTHTALILDIFSCVVPVTRQGVAKCKHRVVVHQRLLLKMERELVKVFQSELPV